MDTYIEPYTLSEEELEDRADAEEQAGEWKFETNNDK